MFVVMLFLSKKKKERKKEVHECFGFPIKSIHEAKKLPSINHVTRLPS